MLDSGCAVVVSKVASWKSIPNGDRKYELTPMKAMPVLEGNWTPPAALSACGVAVAVGVAVNVAVAVWVAVPV